MKARRLLGATWTRPLHRDQISGEVMAGVTVLAYIVPQVLAYSGLIGLPPMAGLATSVVALIVYGLFGGSRVASLGPEATVALITGLVLAPLLAKAPASAPVLTAALTGLVGVWLALGRIVRAGVLSHLLSKPILTGYMTGAGLLMISSQLGKATRTSSSGNTVFEQLTNFVRTMDHVHAPSIAVTVGTLLLMLIVRRIDVRLPAALIGLLTATVLSWLVFKPSYGLLELGAVPQGIPPLALPTLDMSVLSHLLAGSLSIALIVFTDTVLVAQAFATPGEVIRPDRELATLSAVHLLNAFAGGYPAAASSSRTALGRSAGQQSQVAGLITAGGLAVILLFAGPLFTHLPVTALAAIVFWAAIRLIVLDDYRLLWRFRRQEFFVAVATALGTASLGVLPGIALAITLSAAQTLVALARPHEAVQGYVVGLAGMHDVDDYPMHVTIQGLLIYRYDGPIFAYNRQDFKNRLTQAVAVYDPNWIILNVEANMFVDFSGCQTLREVISQHQSRGITIGLARLKNDLRVELEAAGVMDLIGPHVYETLPRAVKAYRDANPGISMPPMPEPGDPFLPMN